MAGGNLLSGPSALSIRLWSIQAGAEPGEISWEGNTPVAFLALDIVTASEGTMVTPGGRFLVATFTSIQSAILAARRLQWAYKGLSDGGIAGTAVAVLVHCTENPTGRGIELTERDIAALGNVEKAVPGQILLTAKAAEILRDLPGLPMRVAAETLLCELLWNSAPDKATRSADEEILSEFIRENGLEDQAPPLPQALPAPSSAAPFPQARGEVDAAADANDTTEGRRISPRILIGASCGVAAVLAIGAFVVFSHKSQTNTAPVHVQTAETAAVRPAAVGTTAAVEQSQSQLTPPAPAISVAIPPTALKAAPDAQQGTKREETAHSRPVLSDSAKSHAAAPAGTSASCGLDATLIPKMLEQAEKSRADGKYAAAKRQFQTVLNCEHGNQRARSGLDRTITAMQHQ